MNNFEFGTFTRSSPSDDAASLAVKDLNEIYTDTCSTERQEGIIYQAVHYPPCRFLVSAASAAADVRFCQTSGLSLRRVPRPRVSAGSA